MSHGILWLFCRMDGSFAVGVVCYDVLHVGHRYLLVSELVLLPPNLTVESLVFGVASLNGL